MVGREVENEMGFSRKLTMGYNVCYPVFIFSIGMLLVKKNSGCSVCDQTPFQDG